MATRYREGDQMVRLWERIDCCDRFYLVEPKVLKSIDELSFSIPHWNLISNILINLDANFKTNCQRVSSITIELKWLHDYMPQLENGAIIGLSGSHFRVIRKRCTRRLENGMRESADDEAIFSLLTSQQTRVLKCCFFSSPPVTSTSFHSSSPRFETDWLKPTLDRWWGFLHLQKYALPQFFPSSSSAQIVEGNHL